MHFGHHKHDIIEVKVYIIEHVNIPVCIQLHCVQKSWIYQDLLGAHLYVNLKLPPSFQAKKFFAPRNGIVNLLQASQQSRFTYNLNYNMHVIWDSKFHKVHTSMKVASIDTWTLKL